MCVCVCVCVRARACVRACVRAIFRQIVAYCTNPTKFQIAYRTNGGVLLLERDSRTKTDTQVANCVGKFDVRAFQVYGP